MNTNKKRIRIIDRMVNPDSDEFKVYLAGIAGLYGGIIGSRHGLTASQVYYRMRQSGTKLSDYRKGNWVSFYVIKKFEEDQDFIRRIQNEIKRRIRKP